MSARLPSPKALSAWMEGVRGLLFPDHFGPADPAALRDVLAAEAGAEAAEGLFGRLPELRRLLGLDVDAALAGDPAATGPDEVILCYPGLRAVAVHRVAHALHLLGVKLVPRILTEQAHSETGIDLHPGARIGERFFIDHGTGVVVGETAVIGDRVRLYQGVTLGARSPKGSGRGEARHPVVEDDVVIYAGATVLGRITVGRGSVIGANAWLSRSVPPGSRVTAAAGREEAYAGGGGI